jgi:hypothetical protein
MLFHFRLTSVDEIEPWTRPSEDNKQFLSWFSLTLGEYWLEVGEVELLRYSPEVIESWARNYPASRATPHVDYQVCRLWEDVLDILPSVLDPLPDDFAHYLLPGGMWSTWAEWQEWDAKAQQWMDASDDADAWKLYHQAIGWRGNRQLDLGYLRAGPGIWLWRGGDTIHIQWDNTNILLDGLVAWDAVAGRVSLPVAEFLSEVWSFSARFLAAMDKRVQEIKAGWARPEVSIDAAQLAQEQQERSGWLSNALSRTGREYEWDEIRAALAEIETHLSG